MKPVINKRHELEGNGVFRLNRLILLRKIIPMGNFHSGPGGRCLVTLSILHYLGYPIYWFLARYGDRLRLLNKIARKLR